MPRLTIDAIRNYVREWFELDNEDLSNTLIDQWIADGYTRIIRVVKDWDYFENVYQLPVVAGTKAYATDPTKAEVITAVEDSMRGPLQWMEHNAARDEWFTTSLPQGRPRAWSEYGSQIYLWPTPDYTGTVEVRGYRAPLDWMAAGAGSVADFPPDFDQPLLDWVMSRAYKQQDDPEMAQLTMEDFRAALDLLVTNHQEAPLAMPVRFSGGGRRWNNAPRGRMRFPFE